MARKRKTPVNTRFGIGERYGCLFHPLPIEERQDFARRAQGRGEKPACPFKPTIYGVPQPCTKKGGVCSLRLYEKGEDGMAIPVAGKGSALRAVCPNRFREKDTVVSWVGAELLGTSEPLAVGEVGFLTSESVSELSIGDDAIDEDGDDVGRIDSVLMHPNLESFAGVPWNFKLFIFQAQECPASLSKPKLKLASGFLSPPLLGVRTIAAVGRSASCRNFKSKSQP